MGFQFCTARLSELTQLVHLHRDFMLTWCILNLVFSVVAALGNLLVIHALWKSSSIPDAVRKLFLSLAFSDFAVGMLSQPMFSVIIAVMLKMASTGDYNFVSFCPAILNVCYFFSFLLSSASFLNIIVITVDRLLAVLLHLRYQELVTSKRVIIALVSLWMTSGVGTFTFILLPKGSRLAVAVISFIGLLVTTVAYIRIYSVVRYHQNQIQSQHQLPQNTQAVDLLRQKKSAYNALIVNVVFIACYLPLFIAIILLTVDSLRISFLIQDQVSVFLAFLNSSVNPFIYCWRYREIREIVKRTVTKIFRMKGQETN